MDRGGARRGDKSSRSDGPSRPPASARHRRRKQRAVSHRRKIRQRLLTDETHQARGPSRFSSCNQREQASHVIRRKGWVSSPPFAKGCETAPGLQRNGKMLQAHHDAARVESRPIFLHQAYETSDGSHEVTRLQSDDIRPRCSGSSSKRRNGACDQARGCRRIKIMGRMLERLGARRHPTKGEREGGQELRRQGLVAGAKRKLLLAPPPSLVVIGRLLKLWQSFFRKQMSAISQSMAAAPLQPLICGLLEANCKKSIDAISQRKIFHSPSIKKAAEAMLKKLKSHKPHLWSPLSLSSLAQALDPRAAIKSKKAADLKSEVRETLKKQCGLGGSPEASDSAAIDSWRV